MDLRLRTASLFGFPPLLIYGLFALPTLWSLLTLGMDTPTLSKHLPGFWQAGFWHFLSLSAMASRIVSDVLLDIGLFLLTLIYVYGAHHLLREDFQPSPGQRRLMLGGLLLGGLVLVTVIPFHSRDLYGYINRGVQQSVYGVNPYTVTVSRIPDWQQEPLFQPHWVDNPSPYGFFYARLASWLTEWADGSFWRAFLYFKLLNWLAFAGSLGLIAILARQLQHPRPWLCAWLFGASPLVVMHALANGHNDMVMVFFLLAALAALFSRFWAWTALPLLSLSIWIKYAPLLVLPLMLIHLIRNRRFKSLGIGILISIALTVWLALPYVTPGEPWPWHTMLENAGRPQHSLIAALGSLVYYPAKWLGGDASGWRDAVQSAFKPMFLLLFAGFYGWQLIRYARQKGRADELVATAGLMLLVLFCGVSAKFHAWYVVAFLPLLLLQPPHSRLFLAGMWLSLFMMAAFTPLQNLPVLNWVILSAVPLWLAWQRKPLPPSGE